MNHGGKFAQSRKMARKKAVLPPKLIPAVHTPVCPPTARLHEATMWHCCQSITSFLDTHAHTQSPCQGQPRVLGPGVSVNQLVEVPRRAVLHHDVEGPAVDEAVLEGGGAGAAEALPGHPCPGTHVRDDFEPTKRVTPPPSPMTRRGGGNNTLWVSMRRGVRVARRFCTPQTSQCWDG